MVKKENIELSNDHLNSLKLIDFQDTFSTTNHKDSIENISIKIFSTSPKWVEWLFNLRNVLVKFIGLKTTKPQNVNLNVEEGGYIHFFKIYKVTDEFIVMGADDKHLNFRAIIENNKKKEYNINVSTLVEFNNRLGRIYFIIIKPFHQIVVRRMVKQAYLK